MATFTEREMDAAASSLHLRLGDQVSLYAEETWIDCGFIGTLGWAPKFDL